MNKRSLTMKACAAFLMIVTTTGNAADPAPGHDGIQDIMPHPLTHTPTAQGLAFLSEAGLLDKDGVHPLTREKLLAYSCNKFRTEMKKRISDIVRNHPPKNDKDEGMKLIHQVLNRLAIEECQSNISSGSSWQTAVFSLIANDTRKGKADKSSTKNSVSPQIDRGIINAVLAAIVTPLCASPENGDSEMTLPERIVADAVAEGLLLAYSEFPRQGTQPSNDMSMASILAITPQPLLAELVPLPAVECHVNQQGALTEFSFGGQRRMTKDARKVTF